MMFCEKCGSEIAADAAFCTSCGAPVLQQPKPAPEQTQAQPEGEQAQYQQPEYEPYTQPRQPEYQQAGYQQQPPYQQPNAQGAPKSKLAAGLLGIFLGGLGIHNFYLGFTKRALIQLLVSLCTCGVGATAMGIWGLVEGIFYLSGHEGYTTDANGVPLGE